MTMVKIAFALRPGGSCRIVKAKSGLIKENIFAEQKLPSH